MRTRTTDRIGIAFVQAGLVVLAACAEPTGTPVHAAAARVPTPRESTASVYWNGVARELVIANNSNPFQAIRGYALVSVAQYNAAVTAEDTKDKGRHASPRAAVAAASAAVLTYLYPSSKAAIEARLADFLAAPAWPGEKHRDAAAGVAVGEAVAQALIARAQTDRFFAPWTGTVPTGPGIWFSDLPPVGAMIGQAKTFFLTSGSQFRPPPPPAFGSAEFEAALAEVRHFSDTRTAEQDSIAKFWALENGTYTPPGYWNEEAAKLALRYRLGEREAAHAFALANMVSYDAIVASHEAKYHYWLLRPTMADPGITLAIGLPNFPSYPSNHAAVSAGMAMILGEIFPAERKRLEALAEEAAISRVYGGIHYRFDGDAGIELGRKVAAFALSMDVNGHEPFVLTP